MNIKKTILVYASVFFITFLVGCSSTQTTPLASLEGINIHEISKPMAENIMISLANEDFSSFSRDFDEAMQKAMTEPAFIEIRKMFWDEYGEYQSLSLTSTSTKQGYLLVFYSLKFEKGEVIMQVVHQPQPPHLVSGLWFPPK